MITPGIIRLILALVLVCGFSFGCSGGTNPVFPGDDIQPGAETIKKITENLSYPQIIGMNGHRQLWGLYEITILGDEVDVEPMRTAEGRFNITNALLQPACSDCIKLTVLSKDTTDAWIRLNVGLKNPTQLEGYDVRGIIITEGEYYLMNPDALTPYVGKMVYDNPNGFRAYANDLSQNKFPAGDPGNPKYYTKDFKIHVPPPLGPDKLVKIKYAVDVSFPGNTEDPYEIKNIDFVHDLNEQTPYARASISVYDWQKDITSVTITPLDGWTGEVPEFFSSNDNHYWVAFFSNCGNNPIGKYTFRVKATSGSGVDSKYLYKDVSVTVKSFVCSTDPKESVTGADKFMVSGQRFVDSLCELNPWDWYRIDFSSMGGFPQNGLLSGKLTVNYCTESIKLSMFYFDPSQGLYLPAMYTIGSGGGSLVIPLHIPNSFYTGEIQEQVYFKVESITDPAPEISYNIIIEYTYSSIDCGEPASSSYLDAQVISFDKGMVQGVLCDPNQQDWYKFDTLGSDAPAGKLTGTLTLEIEDPSPLPPDAITSLSIRDEDGTLLANFYSTIPPDTEPINIGNLDLPSLYTYYITLNSPTGTAIPRSYKMTWDLDIDPTCGPDVIGTENPSPPFINAVPTAWDSFTTPGSSARIWLCGIDDPVDAYPFNIPASFPASGQVLGGNLKILSDSASWPFISVSLGLQDTLTNKFVWYRPIQLTGTTQNIKITDYWQVPTDITAYPMRYWLKVENSGAEWATAQIEPNFSGVNSCSSDGDSAQNPGGVIVPGASGAGFVSINGDSADYWDIDWDASKRLSGIIGAVSASDIRMRLYWHGDLLGTSTGLTPSLNLGQFDFGADCAGPIIKIESLSSPDSCVKYLLSGALLTNASSCDTDPDGNDSIAEIQDKPWLWLNSFGGSDQTCGVVCGSGSNFDFDIYGFNGQDGVQSGWLYGNVGIQTNSTDGHIVGLVAGNMQLVSSNLSPPFYQAFLELSDYNLPSIPPPGYKYYAVAGPDISDPDSFVPYTLFSSIGISTSCTDDNHDVQSEAWDVGLTDTRLGVLCGSGGTFELDSGYPDLVDWFRLIYTQSVSQTLKGTITLRSEHEGLVVKLVAYGQLAGSGSSLAEGTIGIGEDSVTLNVTPLSLPSVPNIGTHYFIVVHNNGTVPDFASYALELNMASN